MGQSGEKLGSVKVLELQIGDEAVAICFAEILNACNQGCISGFAESNCIYNYHLMIMFSGFLRRDFVKINCELSKHQDLGN
jgi:hypothetical protein